MRFDVVNKETWFPARYTADSRDPLYLSADMYAGHYVHVEL